MPLRWCLRGKMVCPAAWANRRICKKFPRTDDLAPIEVTTQGHLLHTLIGSPRRLRVADVQDTLAPFVALFPLFSGDPGDEQTPDHDEQDHENLQGGEATRSEVAWMMGCQLEGILPGTADEVKRAGEALVGTRAGKKSQSSARMTTRLLRVARQERMFKVTSALSPQTY